MQYLALVTFIAFSFEAGMFHLKIDFGQGGVHDWVVVNDGVMGGLSQSSITNMSDGLGFSGVVSLENNGGFASVRSPYGRVDISQASKVKIRYKLENQTIGLVLELHRAFYLPNYKVLLTPTDGEFVTREFEVSEFLKYRMGRKVKGAIGPKELGNVIRIGLITTDKKSGPFNMEVDYIEFY